MNIDDYRKSRNSSYSNKSIKLKKGIRSFINKFLISMIILLCGLILIKSNPSYAKKISKYLYQESIHFTKLKKIYNKYFGKYIGEVEETEKVFSEKISYNSESVYKDGVKLEVNAGYLIPALESGIIIFMGEKEEYGYTVIVEQINGVDTWYSNINPKNIKMYDYIKKGDLIGEAKDKNIYLLFEEKGKFLDYKKYI